MDHLDITSSFHSKNSSTVHHLEEILAGVADTDVTVLIQGETGVGKGVLASEIHRRSVRRSRRLLKVNCAAMPDALLEAELFGYEKGAFTGADGRKVGKFQAAQKGTLLLDEIGDLPFGLQAKLLHVLQDRVFTPLGSTQDHVADVRILASSNRNLEQLVSRGLFREDLFYRLNVVAVHVPPLRERREEIMPLSQQFLTQFIREYRRPLITLTTVLRQAFMQYSWPGNIRELENIIKQIVLFHDQEAVAREIFIRQERSEAQRYPGGAQASRSDGEVLSIGPGGEWLGLKEIGRRAARRAERRAIEEVLHQTSWNRGKAAKILKISYKALLYKIQDCGLGSGLQDQREGKPEAAQVLSFERVKSQSGRRDDCA